MVYPKPVISVIALFAFMASHTMAVAKPTVPLSGNVRVYGYDSTHADRVALGVLLKEGRSDVIEPFTIAQVRIVDKRTFSIAYVSADSTSAPCEVCTVFESILIKPKNKPWREIWSEGSGGTNSCDRGMVYVRRLDAYLKKQKIALSALAPTIHAKLDDGWNQSVQCDFGDLDMDEKLFGKGPE